MSGTVHILNTITRLDIPPERVLSEALKNSELLDGVLVIDRSKEGELYLAGSMASIPEVLYLMQQANYVFNEHISPMSLMATLPDKPGS